MLSVTNLGAACCVIEGDGVRICCDPWFTDGAYLGTWEREHYVPDPIAQIGKVDYIWISHLHPDHYDPDFLHAYFAAHPETQLWCNKNKHLVKMACRDGFQVYGGDMLMRNGVKMHCVQNNGYPQEVDNIDSALVVVDADSAIVNMNDCPFDQAQVTMINHFTDGKTVTALLPYTGAGPWPQCFQMAESARLAAAADKKVHYLDQFQRYRVALFASTAVPFSAGYMLHGPLAHLNPYRGIPEPWEVVGATILPVAGDYGPRPRPTSTGYAWENLPVPENAEIERLLQHASERSPKVGGDPLTIDLNWFAGAAYVDATYQPAVQANETIHVDPRLLYGLLTRKFHWNNAEVGSALSFTRYLNYDPRVLNYLYGFYI